MENSLTLSQATRPMSVSIVTPRGLIHAGKREAYRERGRTGTREEARA